MPTVLQHKVVSALPGTLEANSIYYVRVGSGFDMHITNDSGTIVAYRNNTSIGLDGLLEESGVAHQAISAGLTTSLSISGATYQIPVGSSTPNASQGYPLFEESIAVEADQLVRLDLAIPFVAISSAGNLVVNLCVDGVVVATLVDRLTSGATSGNGINLGTFFKPVSSGTVTVKVMIGPSSSSHTLTLYSQLGAAAQPFLHVLKYGKFEFASTPGTTPGEATASPRGLKRLAIFGDSVTGNNSSSGSRERLKDNGYLPWALRFCQQRYFFPQEWNFGVGGDNTADFLARIQSVIDVAPHIAVGTIGGNDVTQSIPVADTLNNLTEILDRFEAAGIFVVLGKIYPRGPATTYTTAHMQKASTINNFLQRESLRRRGFELLDANPDFVDFTDTTGRGRAKCLPDGIHPGVYGASILGRRLGELLSTLEPPRPDNFTDAGNVYDAANNPEGNLLPNGCMFGTAGTVAVGTGQVATDSRIDAAGSGLTVVCDVASTPTPGAYDNSKESTRIVISGTAGGAGHQIVFKQDAVAIPVGATVEGLATVRVSNLDNARALQLDIRAEHTSGILYAVDCEVGDAVGASGEAGEIFGPGIGEHFDWVLRTPRIVVPSGTTSLSLRVAMGAGPSQSTDLTVEVFDMTLRVVP